MDYHSMAALASSIDRASYVLAGAITKKAEEGRRDALLAAVVTGVSSSLLTIILYLILRGVK
jgi:hypothetical protein